MTIRLDFVTRLTVAVAAPDVLSEGPEGVRRRVAILSGRAEGPGLNADILPGGEDRQLIRPDGLNVLEAHYRLRTDDGAIIDVVNHAFRHGPADVMARMMNGEIVDPALYYFRTAPRLSTDAPQYDWMTRTLFVGDGERTRDAVIVRIHAVL